MSGQGSGGAGDVPGPPRSVEQAAADVIVVAAGASSRMGGRDKQLERLAGRPLLAWTLDGLAASPLVERIVVVAAPDRVAALRGQPWLTSRTVAVVAGGARRQDSVAAGFAALEAIGPADPARPVLVHDGARPLVTPAIVGRVCAAVREHGAAIPVVPVVETLKRIAEGRVITTVDRASLAAAQTPQGVRRGLLREAYRRFPPAGPETWTDEASLLEACTIPVHAIQGDPSNLKVTLVEDLGRAETILAGEREVRVGLGSDSHPFGPGEPLALGGVAIPGAPRLHGHSDGDVALHAVADALLGAAGMGDLGRLHPAGPETPRGVASGGLLQDVVARLHAAGLRAAGVDLTIVGARPRLAAWLDPMRDAVAALVGLPPDRVSVKASSGNLDGMEGAGRGMSALAVAQVERRR